MLQAVNPTEQCARPADAPPPRRDRRIGAAVTSPPPEVLATAVPGRRTPTFTAATTPAGLLRDHLTTAWAELVALAGSVLFVDETSRRIVATPGHRVTIVPGTRHHVQPAEDAEFYERSSDPPDD